MARRKPKPVPEAEFKRDWLDGLPLMGLASKYGISRDRVTTLRDEFGLPKRHDRRLRYKPKQRSDPSPRAIRKACEEIRSKWDAETEAERRVIKPTQWEIPAYDFNLDDLSDEFDRDEW